MYSHGAVRILTWILAAVIAAPLFAEESSFAPLVKDGRPTVYLDRTNADDTIAVALDDFIATIARISGAKIPAEPGDGLTPLYVGEADHFESLEFDVPKLDPESFVIHVAPDAIHLIGGSPLGTQHALYTVLRDLGCRWIMPGAIGECIPESKDLVLPVQHMVDEPDFLFRDIWYAYGCSPEGSQRRAEWLRRNRMNRPAIQHGHNLTNTLAVFAPFEERPELYSLNDGERKKSQICTSNPEVVELVAKAIAQHLDAHPETIAYSLCPDDNTDFCECDNCTALDSGRIDSGGKPSISDRYQVFLNGVSEHLKSSHPNVWLTHYAYNENHTDPPVNTAVDPNTCIFATTSVYCSAHGIGDAFCPSRVAFKELLAQWTSLTDHVFIYEYDPVPYSGGLPWPMWESHATEMAAYKALGVKGVSFEGQNSWAAYFPNYWLAAQCMWDSTLDGDALFEDLMQSFFREAAPEMSEYYDALAEPFRGLERKVEWGLSEYPKFFTRDVVTTAGEALARAQARATTPVVQQRLEMVGLSHEEMDAYVTLRTADDSVTFEEYQQAIGRLNAAIDRMEAINEDYLLADIAREKTAVGIADRFAQEQGFVNRWLLCGPFDNLGMDGHDKAYPPEQAIDLDATYEGKDGAPVKWRPNHTPEWTGYVDLLPEYDQTDWVCVYALCWVTLDDGPRDVMFRIGSNDSVKAFLNGEEVWDNKISRPAAADDDLVPVTLPEGTSTVLLKIGQTGKDWGLYFRITERDSDAIPPGLQITDELVN
ncbi:MAG: hypothetical protein AMXMBFR82_26130 [Candidatus Hydrogenedentota bacterium]